MTDFYHDDPIEELGSERKKPKALFGSVLLLFAGGLFLNTTLAANISLNSGGRVEFGQGMTLTAACAGSTALTVTPNSSFVNAAGAGAHFSIVSEFLEYPLAATVLTSLYLSMTQQHPLRFHSLIRVRL